MKTSILDKIIWFPQTHNSDKIFLNKETRSIFLQKSSKVNKGTTGVLYSKKCNKSIRYESQLELNFFATLEASNKVIDYGAQPVKILYQNQERYYTPDFYLKFDNGRIAIGEIKQVRDMGYYSNWKKWKAMKEYCREHGLGFLITDGMTSISDLNQPIKNNNFENAILELFNERDTLEWKDLYHIKETHKATMTDLVKVVVKHKLKWIQKPFKLKKATTNS